MRTPDPQTSGIPRRGVIVTSAGAAAAASLLTACGGDDTPSGSQSPASSSNGGSAGGGGRSLVKLADVPVGGAVSAKGADGKPLIVAQPTAGQAVCFSAICTHMGCEVAPDGATLKCPCHGSTYEAATGKNTGGPAPRPLAAVTVKVVGGEVVAG